VIVSKLVAGSKGKGYANSCPNKSPLFPPSGKSKISHQIWKAYTKQICVVGLLSSKKQSFKTAYSAVMAYHYLYCGRPSWDAIDFPLFGIVPLENGHR